MKSLENVNNIKLSSSLGTQLKAIGNATEQIKWTDQDKLAGLAKGLKPLSELGKANLTTFINQLGKLSTVIDELEKADLEKFALQIRQVTAAIQPLATEMQKVSAGFAAFPIRIQKIIASSEGLAVANKRTTSSFRLFGSGTVSYTHLDVYKRQIVRYLPMKRNLLNYREKQLLPAH